jgi:2,4'-dihydroxyacetophenone dioxygenase
MTTETARTLDERAIPYQLPQPADMSDDLVHLGILDKWLKDDNLWVPTTKTVSFKPLLLSASQGYFVNLLRVRQSGVLSRHRHAGPVHAIVLKGKWYYLEHDWVAEQGG